MLKKIYENFEEILTCSFFLLMFLLLVAGVILRFCFSISFAWNIELSRYTLVWLAFVGAAYVRRSDGHIKIDLFSNYLQERLPPFGVAVYRIAAKLISVVYLALLVYFSYQLSIQTWRFKSSAMQIPQSFLYISVGLGALMYLGREILDSLHGYMRRRYREAGE
jgi:TRAP-type C4-dicarboxylate transport system permease small subunit